MNIAKKSFVSIIIPTLNEATTLPDLAASLGRLRGEFEVIVCDGGSADATVEMARQYGLRVIEAPRGRGPQMNAGGRLAKGETLLFLHADTRLPESALEFVAGALAFVFLDPSLSSSGFFTAVIIIVCYWGATLVTLRGGDLFAKLGSWGGIIGTLFPAVLLIVFGAVWVFSGEKSQVPLEASAVIPPFTGLASIVLIVSNVLAYAGMEVNAVHVNQMKDPGKGYPRSVFLAAGLILLVFILPTIAIAVAVPKKELGLTNGIMLAFGEYFDHWDMGWATAVVSALIAAGALASVVTWVAGPSKGVLAAAETGLLPPLLQKRNKAGVQSGILMLQGTIVTILAAIFIIVPNVSAAFVALIDMAAALYLIMYMLMFASAMVLRRKAPDVPRAYRVKALPFVAGVGFVACLAAFLLAFIPPDGFTAFPAAAYPWIVGAVIVVLGAPPLLFYALRKPSWDRRPADGSLLSDAHPEA